MNITWSPEARTDLREYAAKALYERIETATTGLIENPYIGRPGRVPGTRELVITNTSYILPYQIRQNQLEILRVYHGARKWPKHFD